MAKEFKLPDLGEGIHEGEVLAVRVQVGQRVKEGDIILEVETDKAAVEIPSPYTGTVAEIRVQKGDTVKVGQVMMTFETAGQAETAVPAGKPAVPAAPAAPSAAPAPATAREKGPVPASPATRRLARELGVDLAAVPPTGAAGLVTAADVRAFAEGRKAAPTTSPSARARVCRRPQGCADHVALRTGHRRKCRRRPSRLRLRRQRSFRTSVAGA